ncbi:MAG: septum formation protein Maf [Elusimicrobia bacterium]|nr:septum formation protein Maf [Elusimicrobiota bacterium]
MGRVTRPLVLASASPQRKKLLRELGLPFRIVPSRVPEDSRERNPRRLAGELALRKAEAVAKRRPGTLVLGADTVVWCAGELLGKPSGREEARRILGRLNGRWHRVYTGVALVDADSGRAWREVALSRVKARRLPDAELDRLAGKHMDKAGAYAVQDREDPFIEKIEGDYDNVVGLPLASVRRLLKRVARGR